MTQLSAVSADFDTIEVADFENSVVGSVLQTVYFRTNEHMVIAHEDNLMYSLSALSASITPKADNSVFLLIAKMYLNLLLKCIDSYTYSYMGTFAGHKWASYS